MKTKLFTLTRKDFRWEYYRGSGPGGQKKNKTSSACRCTHTESGAMATCEEHREQSRNRQVAFQRCIKIDKFQKWLRVEVARRDGTAAKIEEEVDRLMDERYLKIEYGKGE